MELTEEQKSQLKELGKELALSVAAEVAFSAATSLVFLVVEIDSTTAGQILLSTTD